MSFLLLMLLAGCAGWAAGPDAHEPVTIASKSDVMRVWGGLVTEVLVEGVSPACSRVQAEPPHIIADFSDDDARRARWVELGVASCSGAIPHPRGGSWELEGAGSWMGRRPITIAEMPAAGPWSCSVRVSLDPRAEGPVDIAGEWTVIAGGGCERFSGL